MADCPQLNLSKAQNPALKALGLKASKMTPDHLAEVVSIEKNTAKNPWTETQLSNSIATTVVLKDKKLVIGFAVIAMVADQAELHNIAIHPQWQGQGLGSVFLHALIKTVPSTIKMMYLEVRVTNFRAIRLYSGLGFEEIAEREGYYRSGLGSEDALIMCKVLDSTNK
jgi:ribosomal-protein-alanine N-acetyltransferase